MDENAIAQLLEDWSSNPAPAATADAAERAQMVGLDGPAIW